MKIGLRRITHGYTLAIFHCTDTRCPMFVFNAQSQRVLAHALKGRCSETGKALFELSLIYATDAGNALKRAVMA